MVGMNFFTQRIEIRRQIDLKVMASVPKSAPKDTASALSGMSSRHSFASKLLYILWFSPCSFLAYHWCCNSLSLIPECSCHQCKVSVNAYNDSFFPALFRVVVKVELVMEVVPVVT